MGNYTTYDFFNKNVYVTGDIHGNYALLINKLKTNNINNALIIVAGDIGIGFEKSEHYHQVYSANMSKYLRQNDIDILCIRGNHDDPQYFNEPNMAINEKHWKCIPDYSVIRVFNNSEDLNTPTITMLGVGGATSIDRTHRLREELKYSLMAKKYGSTLKKFYWDGEHPFYDKEALNKIKEDGILIDTVITHTCPSFAYPTHKKGIEYWILMDADLDKDLDTERKIMDNIYFHLIDDKQPIKQWYYGHYHSTNVQMYDNIKFKLMNCIDYNFELIKLL